LKIGTLVSELKDLLNAELGNTDSRSKAMITCYPGAGTRYTKHIDNGGIASNGRRLTTLLYLNKNWVEADGGKLSLYERGGKRLKMEVAPIANRVVLFWSDARVPHEVLPSEANRYTITTWFFDNVEWAEAKRIGLVPKKTDVVQEEDEDVDDDRGKEQHQQQQQAGDGNSSTTVEEGSGDTKKNQQQQQQQQQIAKVQPSLQFCPEDDLSAREPSAEHLTAVIPADISSISLNAAPSSSTSTLMMKMTSNISVTTSNVIVTIFLPSALKSLEGIALDCGENSLEVTSTEHSIVAPLAPLVVKLPLKVDSLSCKAKFSKRKGTLTATIAIA
jgi:hypothetical protein